MPPWAILSGIAAAATGIMLCLYLVQRRSRDAGIVDAGWALGLAGAAAACAALADGNPAHRLALAAVACPWGLRLGVYLLRDRVLRGEEDGRYAALRADWGPRADRNFLFLFLFQAALIPLFSVPFLAVAAHPGPFRWWHAAGVLVGWGAILGESVADRQLARFRAVPEHRGQTCRSGLWAYSRHPNYFFEWLHWWSYAALGAGYLAGCVALLGPIIMFAFLHRVTGIPYTERQALKSRGDDFRAYQREVNAFFPWFPRQGRP